MGKRMIGVMFLISCLVTGCASGIEQEEAGRTQETRAYKLEAKSSVEQEDCFICGKHSKSLMSYYEKKDSIGLVHWNSGTIMDTEVRTYDENGNEVFRQDGNMKFTCFGEENGSVMISPMPNRGISEATVTYTNEDEVSFDLLKQELCQECLDQVAEFYTDQRNMGEDSHLAATGYCLVDFQTKQLYPLSDPYRMYFIRDYHVSYEIKEDLGGAGNRIEVQFFYAPERDS